MEMTATYSPEDNKLRLYSSTRLNSETYARVKAAGFKWTPQREDLLVRLCGSIEDEDKSLVQRAEERADRFENYSERRADDAQQARRRVDAIVEHIPFGQPILVGHHSERRARKDAERIHEGMRKSVKMWDTSDYWARRAEAAIQHAKYKERPDVRARRIKKLEAAQRKMERTKAEAERLTKAWSQPGLTMQEAAKIASHDRGHFLSASQRTDGQTWPVSLWDATQGRCEPPPKVEEIAAKAVRNHEKVSAWADRWLNHYANRLTYERAMLMQDGGTVADQQKPEVGGACKCWASPRGGWSLIQKVNKVSVTVLDNWGNGGRDFTRTIPFDKLTAIMSRAEVESARQAGLISGEQPIGFHLSAKPTDPAPVEVKPALQKSEGSDSKVSTSQPPSAAHAPVQLNLFPRRNGPSHKRGMGL